MDQKKNKLTKSHVMGTEASRETSDLRTIPQVIQYYAGKCPEKEAVVFVSTDGRREAVTYKEVYEKSKIVAHNLVSLGVKPKEVVAIINLRTCPEWLYIAFGSMMAGALPLGAFFKYKDGSDLIALMEKLKTCSCLVMDPGYEDENWNILSKLLEEYSLDGSVTSQRMPSLRYLLCHHPEQKISGVKSFSELLIDTAPKPDLPDLHESDIAGLFQTSGSTGTQKVVAHTHVSLLTTTRLRSAERCSASISFIERSFSWMGGYPFSIFIGSTRVTCSGFCPVPTDKAKFLCDVILQEKCQILFLLPNLLHKIAEMGKLEENWPVKSIVIGGQQITKQMLSCIGTVCEHVLVSYGASENVQVSNVVVSDVEQFVDFSIGYAIPGMEVKIVDSEERVVSLNTCGEIYAKGKSLFREYYNDPEKTAAAFTEDGWYKTNDYGRMLEDGLLIMEGRKSNMIICRGINVAPGILEKVILKCPGVESCVIVPVPDDVMYQVICACVKMVPRSGVDETVLRKFCVDAHGDKLGLFTVLPKYYLLLDSFPETSTGKVSRRELEAIAEKTFRK